MRVDPKKPPVSWILCLLLAVSGCSSERPSTASREPVYETEGYGHVLQMLDGSARLWEVSSVACLPSFDLVVEPEARGAAEALLTIADAGMHIELLPGETVDEKWLRLEGTASMRRLRRVDQLPASCVDPAESASASSPLLVFDVFWQAFHDHYPFFAMKGVDWDAVRERERAKLRPETSDEELFEILVGMMEPLEDAHTFLSAPGLEETFRGRRADPHPLSAEQRARALEIVDQTYLEEAPQAHCNDQLALGTLRGGASYFRLRSFSSYGADFRSGLDCLRDTLDTLFAGASDATGLVIDIRINGGGSDPYGLEIASRLAGAEYLAYSKQVRNDSEDPASWSEAQPSLVRPSERPGYRGPAVLLTSRYSVSAAETFTMALMGREPAVVRIGEHTQGVFSDVLSRSLPNGWSFGLPNEQFLTEDGRTFDGPGIPPDVSMPVFTGDDLEAGVDPVLEEADSDPPAAGGRRSRLTPPASPRAQASLSRHACLRPLQVGEWRPTTHPTTAGEETAMAKKSPENADTHHQPTRRGVLAGATALGTLAIGFTRPAAAAVGADAVTQTASFGIDSARTKEAIEALRGLVAAVEEKEPGVLAYIAHQNPESPDQIFFFEIYENAAALENHGKQPHLAALGEGFQTGLFKPPVEIVKLDRIAGFSR